MSEIAWPRHPGSDSMADLIQASKAGMDSKGS